MASLWVMPRKDARPVRVRRRGFEFLIVWGGITLLNTAIWVALVFLIGRYA